MITVVGMGPGKEAMMTEEALAALDRADVIIGYTVYLELLGDRFAGKEYLSTPMKQEVERCRMCFEQATMGKEVAMICSGDAGIYGMASLMFELGEEYDAQNPGASMLTDICVIPGITAASWELIEKRLRAAADGDFAIAIYNPSSRKRHDYLQKACDILMEKADPERACGYVRNIGRDGTESHVCTLAELRDTQVDMFTTVFVGNSQSRIIGDRLVTPRGYKK